MLTSASSKGESLRPSKSSLLLKKAHIMGVIQANVVKDRKPALSTGWGLQQGTIQRQHRQAWPQSDSG